jgi:hypothetical protein
MYVGPKNVWAQNILTAENVWPKKCFGRKIIGEGGETFVGRYKCFRHKVDRKGTAYTSTRLTSPEPQNKFDSKKMFSRNNVWPKNSEKMFGRTIPKKCFAEILKHISEGFASIVGKTPASLEFERSRFQVLPASSYKFCMFVKHNITLSFKAV